MIRVFSFLPALALTAGVALAQDAAAPEAPVQEAPAQMDAAMAYESARNQLGVLKHCQAEGHIDGQAVEIQERLLTMIPEGDAAAGDAAEAKGAAGTVSAMGAEQTLADAATAQGSSVEALCQQMDSMIQELAAQLPS
ncbi:pore-forming ESAT-6 family protein [uncultured Paracoccus sp.]|uniref:pore-forming ESAT-6 family protein n=1 Tax=uncultured Paracoccus sp. TaxID=189685 RepID=UPI0025D1C72F|nr:pore-forming ESAT-6 family protein [uncultured Paracoccus sp.]